MIPAKPAGLAATPHDGSVALSWTNPDNSSITRWEYRYKTGSGDFGSWTEVANSGAATTAASLTLANGKTYGFELRAVNATGNGAASDEATATMIPAAPANVAAASGNGKVSLSWTDPGNATITRWEFRLRQENRAWNAWVAISGSTASTTSHLVTGPANGFSFSFQVRAVNATGNSSASATVTGIPRNVSVGLSASPADHGENEGAATVTVTATLVGPIGVNNRRLPAVPFLVPTAIAVRVGSSTDTATAGTDYAPVGNFTIVIPANATSATGTFTLTPIDDAVGEESETITASGAAPGLSVGSASLTLTDNETNSLVFTAVESGHERYPVGSFPVPSLQGLPQRAIEPSVVVIIQRDDNHRLGLVYAECLTNCRGCCHGSAYRPQAICNPVARIGEGVLDLLVSFGHVDE